MNEEQVNEQWFSKGELLKIYNDSPEKLSYPLMLTIKNFLL